MNTTWRMNNAPVNDVKTYISCNPPEGEHKVRPFHKTYFLFRYLNRVNVL